MLKRENPIQIRVATKEGGNEMKKLAVLCGVVLLLLLSTMAVIGCGPTVDPHDGAIDETKYQGGAGDGFSVISSEETTLDGAPAPAE